MEPDLFRLNTNQFLQTARTVTFIIQKGKHSIGGFSEWYDATVTEPWKADPIMVWAKDSRNIIEKQGDLDLYSHAHATLISSYLSENDSAIQVGPSELLRIGIKKLVRVARKQLPTGISAAAVIRVERRWVASSLKEWELLHALTYVYTRIHGACKELGRRLQQPLAPEILDPASFESFRDEAQKVAYIKLATLDTYSMAQESQTVSRADQVPEELKKVLDSVKPRKDDSNTAEGTANYLHAMAEATFLHFGNHVPMLFLYNSAWIPIDMVSTHFSDQADKYIFWRRMADRVKTLGAYGMGWISESWTREMGNYPRVPISGLPIIGEQLNVIVMDKSGNLITRTSRILRSAPEGATTLEHMEKDEFDAIAPNYLVPMKRAWGLPDGLII